MISLWHFQLPHTIFSSKAEALIISSFCHIDHKHLLFWSKYWSSEHNRGHVAGVLVTYSDYVETVDI